jgi:hypothetical protein
MPFSKEYRTKVLKKITKHIESQQIAPMHIYQDRKASKVAQVKQVKKIGALSSREWYRTQYHKSHFPQRKKIERKILLKL